MLPVDVAVKSQTQKNASIVPILLSYYAYVDPSL